MNSVILTQVGSGATRAYQTDTWPTPFSVGFGCVVSGGVTYSVQHTFDDIQTVSSPTWFESPDVSNVSATKQGAYITPVNAIRLNVTSGSGAVTMTLTQAGIGS